MNNTLVQTKHARRKTGMRCAGDGAALAPLWAAGACGEVVALPASTSEADKASEDEEHVVKLGTRRYHQYAAGEEEEGSGPYLIVSCQKAGLLSRIIVVAQHEDVLVVRIS